MGTTIVPEVNNKDNISNCHKEATRLALKYNFVTDLTSLVIEEDDDYIKKGPIEIEKKPGLAQEGISPFFSSPKFALSASSFSAGFGGFKSSGPSRRRRPQRPLTASFFPGGGSSQTSTTSFNFAFTTTTTTYTTRTTAGYCKLIMYDQTYFRGQSLELNGDVNDLSDLSFDNEVASLKIEGDCNWTL